MEKVCNVGRAGILCDRYRPPGTIIDNFSYMYACCLTIRTVNLKRTHTPVVFYQQLLSYYNIKLVYNTFILNCVININHAHPLEEVTVNELLWCHHAPHLDVHGLMVTLIWLYNCHH